MNLHSCYVSPLAIDGVVKTLKSGYLNEGERVQELEYRLESQYGLINPIAVNSCTSALHLALILAGVSRGDEVILPAQTFIATGLAVLMVGATPVFADIKRFTGNIDPSDVEHKITAKTKAIIAVDWAGRIAEIEKLQFGVPVIEDAAHSFGATRLGNRVGSIADFTTFSFQAIKSLTAGDGGILACLKESDAKRGRKLKWFGLDKSEKPNVLGERETGVSELGFKYNMNDVSASIVLGNLEFFDMRLRWVKEIAAEYYNSLASIPEVQLMNWDDESSHWLFPIFCRDRNKKLLALKNMGVPASIIHRRIDSHPVFRGEANLQNQTWFDAHHISLPIHSEMTCKDVEEVIYAVRRVCAVS